ncbi:MAG: HD domain-containing protein [Firmicutes bacterium]|nr:HD domain-containing protein [Bacillota bacterium]
MGAIEHNQRHADLVADLSRKILQTLGYPTREAELAAIAGFLHDLGNMANRYGHGLTGAIFAYNLLREMGMPPEELAVVMSAIGNHEEKAGGHPVTPVGAAVILADKSDVHHTRVRKTDLAQFTRRDRVNYAARQSLLDVNPEQRVITMKLIIDPQICSVMEYFEIFLAKMIMCRRAAAALQCQFELIINDAKLL